MEFLKNKWAKENAHRLKKQLWALSGNRIAGRFEYEWTTPASGGAVMAMRTGSLTNTATWPNDTPASTTSRSRKPSESFAGHGSINLTVTFLHDATRIARSLWQEGRHIDIIEMRARHRASGRKEIGSGDFGSFVHDLGSPLSGSKSPLGRSFERQLRNISCTSNQRPHSDLKRSKSELDSRECAFISYSK